VKVGATCVAALGLKKEIPHLGRLAKLKIRNKKYTDQWASVLTMSFHPSKYLAVSYYFMDKCMKKLMKWYEKRAEYFACFFGKDQCFQKNGLWLINVILNSAKVWDCEIMVT